MVDFKKIIGEKIAKAAELDAQEVTSYIEIPPNTDLGDYLLLPSSMISDYTNHTENKNKFLDDMTIEELEERLNTKIILTKGDGGQLLKDILGVE